MLLYCFVCIAYVQFTVQILSLVQNVRGWPLSTSRNGTEVLAWAGVKPWLYRRGHAQA